MGGRFESTMGVSQEEPGVSPRMPEPIIAKSGRARRRGGSCLFLGSEGRGFPWG